VHADDKKLSEKGGFRNRKHGFHLHRFRLIGIMSATGFEECFVLRRSYKRSTVIRLRLHTSRSDLPSSSISSSSTSPSPVGSPDFFCNFFRSSSGKWKLVLRLDVLPAEAELDRPWVEVVKERRLALAVVFTSVSFLSSERRVWSAFGDSMRRDEDDAVDC
jgi:hypothetical protein